MVGQVVADLVGVECSPGTGEVVDRALGRETEAKPNVAEVQIDPAKVGRENSAANWVAAVAPPAKSAGQIIEDEDTGETVEKIVAWLDERKLI